MENNFTVSLKEFATGKFQMVARTSAGLEEVLAEELKELGASDVLIKKRAVEFSGDLELLYSANLWCRTALRILIPLYSFFIRKQKDLYNRVKNYPWEEHFSASNTIRVDSAVHNSGFTNSHFVSLFTKDAIVDRFRDNLGERPSVDKDNPDFRIFVHLANNECTILLDSSGDSLHKRGYRLEGGEAPVNEILAAGMIMMSGWKGESPFYDPMCGSGTILVEAALIANNIPPGYSRENFGFHYWNGFDKELWDKVKQESILQKKKLENGIFGSDICYDTIGIALNNIKRAGFEDDISLENVPFEHSVPPASGGIIITNPPYGERLVKEDINAFYKEVGNTFKHKYKGYTAWLITSEMEALKNVGLRTSRRIIVNNGPLECRFVKYELYEGSRKKK